MDDMKKQVYEVFCSKIEKGSKNISHFNSNFDKDDRNEFIEVAVEYFADKDCNNADSYYLRGRSKFCNSDRAGALVDFDKAIELGSKTIMYGHRGLAKYFLDDFEGAIDDFGQHLMLIRNFSSDVGGSLVPSYVYQLLGRSKFKLEKFREAIKDYDEAINREPGVAEFYDDRAKAEMRVALLPHSVLGNLFAYDTDIVKALADHEKAIELAPTNSTYYYNLATTFDIIADAGKDERAKLKPGEAKQKAEEAKQKSMELLGLGKLKKDV